MCVVDANNARFCTNRQGEIILHPVEYDGWTRSV